MTSHRASQLPSARAGLAPGLRWACARTMTMLLHLPLLFTLPSHTLTLSQLLQQRAGPRARFSSAGRLGRALRHHSSRTHLHVPISRNSSASQQPQCSELRRRSLDLVGVDYWISAHTHTPQTCSSLLPCCFLLVFSCSHSVVGLFRRGPPPIFTVMRVLRSNPTPEVHFFRPPRFLRLCAEKLFPFLSLCSPGADSCSDSFVW